MNCTTSRWSAIGLSLGVLCLTLLSEQALAQKGPDVTQITFGEGDVIRGHFVQVNDKTWNRLNPDRSVVSSFTETARDEWSVYLIDGSGTVSAHINLWTKLVTQGSDTLGSILSASSAPITETAEPVKGPNVTEVAFGEGDVTRGHFVQVGDKTWNRLNPDRSVVSSFTETGRDEWSVYLIDASGTISAHINLWTKVVTLGSETLGSVLNTSSAPIAVPPPPVQGEVVITRQAPAVGEIVIGTIVQPAVEPNPQPSGETPSNVPPEGGQIVLAPVTSPNTQPIYVGENDPGALPSIVCTPPVGEEPRDNWMINMWPSPVTTNSKSLLVDAAVRMLNRRGIAVSDGELQRVAAGVKTDPVARYQFAPFMLGTFFDALVAENPSDVQTEYKAHFERYQGCRDYYRAVATLQEWNQYQGKETIGSVPAYQPALLSAVNFNHSPSVSGFIQSDPLAYGPRGGEAVALLYSQMASKTGALEDHPLDSALGSLNDDMTGVAVAAGLGSAAAVPAVLVGGTAAYLAAATAKVATQIGVGVVPGVTSSALPANIAVSLANLAGPAIVAIAAAAILGSTIAEVAQKAALEEKLRNAASNPYFSVAEFLNVPLGQQETRRNALFTLMVKHLIAGPVEAGRLTLELPEIPCLAGYGRASDGSCVLQVSFHPENGLSLPQAQDLSRKNNWRIATAEEVSRAWEKLGFEAFAYGLVADGRFAVPVQSAMGGFQRGANIGAQGGNQGFFYVPRVEYVSWGGLSLKQAEDITGNRGNRLATPEEVQTAWEKQGLDVFAYGMLDDGRFAVPIQSARGSFQRGANMGAQGGNQGFFLVRNAPQTPGDLYYRGQQPLECALGTQMEDGVCYRPCQAGYRGVAALCYANCPAGFRDDGLYCAKPAAHEREGFPWQIGDPPLPNYSGPIGRCEAKYGGADIKFHSQAGLSLAQAMQIAVSNGWQLATADQVQKAWQNGLDVYAFGMMLDGRFAVPVQADHSNFKRGANIGAQGGNQGFFYSLPACEQAGAIIYPKCKANYHAATVNLCSPDCPSGMTDIGVSCAKNSYDRGVGQPINTCPAGTEQVGALCYPLCRAGFRGQLDWCYKE